MKNIWAIIFFLMCFPGHAQEQNALCDRTLTACYQIRFCPVLGKKEALKEMVVMVRFQNGEREKLLAEDEGVIEVDSIYDAFMKKRKCSGAYSITLSAENYREVSGLEILERRDTLELALNTDESPREYGMRHTGGEESLYLSKVLTNDFLLDGDFYLPHLIDSKFAEDEEEERQSENSSEEHFPFTSVFWFEEGYEEERKKLIPWGYSEFSFLPHLL